MVNSTSIRSQKPLNFPPGSGRIPDSWGVTATPRDHGLGRCDPSGSWFASTTKWLAPVPSENRSRCTLPYRRQPTFSSLATG
jgi:hypothetical protein